MKSTAFINTCLWQRINKSSHHLSSTNWPLAQRLIAKWDSLLWLTTKIKYLCCFPAVIKLMYMFISLICLLWTVWLLNKFKYPIHLEFEFCFWFRLLCVVLFEEFQGRIQNICISRNLMRCVQAECSISYCPIIWLYVCCLSRPWTLKTFLLFFSFISFT